MIDASLLQRSSKGVAAWLLIGVAMIVIQILLGGITRLTGSGLSITEWKPILGTLPPLNQYEWEAAFEQYKKIGQYNYLNAHFNLSDFKFIYFWEWFHRLWARLIGIVFIIPFIYFIIKRSFKKEMIAPLIMLFILGGLQGAIGWVMVQSGLNSEDIYVSHIRLAIHFMAALVLLAYTFWFALGLIVPKGQFVVHAMLKKLTVLIMVLLTLQLIYGAFMAGLKAATFAPTWPTINGSWLPEGLVKYPGLKNFTDNPIAVHFIHRGLAYILTLLAFVWWAKANKISGDNLFTRTRWLPPSIILVQVILGISTVINSAKPEWLLWLGVAHQFFGIVFLLVMLWMFYIIHNVSKLEVRV